MQRCNICIEEDCKGKKDCHCDNCAHCKECNKILHATIRITTKCTQSCSHCCFECSPKKSDMMSVDTAKKIALFLGSNNISNITLMGGEFFCNPSWVDIFDTLIPVTAYTRLVTNGDWADNSAVPRILKRFPNLKVSISKDRWHTNEHVDEAIAACKEFGLRYNVAGDEETTEESVVPVGRSSFEAFGIYGMFGCWCHNPAHKYSFMIDEVGKIYKCGFGIWDYANIEDHLEGGFDKEFKELNQKFHKIFISNCRRCASSYNKSGF